MQDDPRDRKPEEELKEGEELPVEKLDERERPGKPDDAAPEDDRPAAA